MPDEPSNRALDHELNLLAGMRPRVKEIDARLAPARLLSRFMTLEQGREKVGISQRQVGTRPLHGP